ncbi:MAG: transcriptional repressor LexA [Candidatus Marinimicrobia bacterium]|nr:transcriptional repressor LexA [Candidatus Neomarinimicrobiota bacterium]
MITARQKEVLEFIRQRLEESGISPSYREIRTALGLKSLSTVTYHVRGLMRAGLLVNARGYHGKRALQVVAQDTEQAGEIPLAGLIAAGRPIEALDTGETVAVPPTFSGPEHYALKVQGDSMTGDGVLDGDVVIVRQVDTANHREMVVALINGEGTLKRLSREHGRTRLLPANPQYPIIDIAPEDDFRIQGVAIGVIRRF